MAFLNRAGGGGENVTPEVQIQTPLIEDIKESLVGKATGANATEDTILEGYSAYVGQELVEGKYKPHGLYIWKKLTAEGGDFIDYVVSNTETAYPDDGTQDGYYYKKMDMDMAGINVKGWYTIDSQNGYHMTIPYDIYDGVCVVLNDEIHILGSNSSSYKQNHYKWDGSTWASVSTLPYGLGGGAAVVLNGEIHVLGGSSGVTKHYKWDGSAWTSVSTLPYDLYHGCAVVLNNEIHILGSEQASNYYKYHYKWDGNTWISVSTLPYNLYGGAAVVLNGEIHVLGSYQSTSYQTYHYKWNGSAWTSVSTLPYNFAYACAVIQDNEIHILGSYLDARGKNHYKWNGTAWSSVSTLPDAFYYGAAAILNNEIHILYGDYTAVEETGYHYAYKP